MKIFNEFARRGFSAWFLTVDRRSRRSEIFVGLKGAVVLVVVELV